MSRRIRRRTNWSDENRAEIRTVFGRRPEAEVVLVCKACGSSLASVQRYANGVALHTNADTTPLEPEGRYVVECETCPKSYPRRGAELIALARSGRGSPHRMH